MKAQLLQPGFMIALSSRMKGGIEYLTLHEEASKREDGSLTQKWETTKNVSDIDEHERGVKVRGAALYEIKKLCVSTPFCLLCPDSNEAELDAGVEVAQGLVAAFNNSSTYTKIRLYVLKAKLLGDDEQTSAAIAGEMRNLFSEMDQAIRKMDPEAIRDAATKADEISQMLVLEQKEKVSEAILSARKVAREITKTIKQKGIGAINVASDYQEQLLAVSAASKVFLDFEEPTLLAPEDEAAPVQVQELDLESSAPTSVPAPYLDCALDLSN